MTDSICIFHNGNQRIVDNYRKKFADLDFKGNWTCNEFTDGSLYEISHADASLEILLDIRNHQVKIIRHISDYNDDLKYSLPECNIPDYHNWLNNIVSKFICVSDTVVSELVFENKQNNKHVVITTGRTANTHYRLYLNETYGINAVENNKIIDSELLDSNSATFLFRKNHWESAASLWIAKFNGFSQTYNGVSTVKEFSTTPKLDHEWLKSVWLDMCILALDHSIFYKYVLKKPIDVKTTEEIVSQFNTASEKNKYKKEQLIKNYDYSKTWYNKNLAPKINCLYNNTKQLLEKV